MRGVDQSPIRVLDVIDSCRTAEHLLTARTYAHLWIRRFGSRDTNWFGLLFTTYLMDKNSLLLLEEKREKAKDNHSQA